MSQNLNLSKFGPYEKKLRNQDNIKNDDIFTIILCDRQAC